MESAAAVEIRDIIVGPYRYRARVAGPLTGELVIMLHGFPQTSFEWLHHIAVLANAGYRVVAPDQRGYSPGARPAGVEHYVLSELTADVLGFAAASGREQFHLVAHDWGAVVAWATAARHPERLLSLTAVSFAHPDAFARALNDPTTDQAERSFYVSMLKEPGTGEAMLADADGAGLRGGFEHTGLVGADVSEYVETLLQPGALEATLNWYRANDFARSGIGPIDVPTLYVWGKHDNAVGRESAEWTAQYVRGPYTFAAVDTHHWLPEGAPSELSELLLNHLAANATHS